MVGELGGKRPSDKLQSRKEDMVEVPCEAVVVHESKMDEKGEEGDDGRVDNERSVGGAAQIAGDGALAVGAAAEQVDDAGPEAIPALEVRTDL